MQPKIIFLGTAGGFEAVGKQLRASGGIIVQADGLQILIDPGPGCLAKAREFGVNIRDTNAIFLSHTHYGHSNDLNVAIQAITLNGIDKKGFLLAGEEIIKDLPEHSMKLLERAVPLEPGKIVRINNVEFIATSTKHEVACLGFKLTTSDFTLSYLADTKYFKNLENEHKNCDVLLCNCKMPAGMKDEQNTNSSDIIRLAEKIKPKLIVLTHFSATMLKKDPLFEAREVQRELNIHTIAAKDGMIINPSSHAAKVRQKTLSVFDKE